MTPQKQTRRNKSAKSYNQRDTMHSQTGQTGSCDINEQGLKRKLLWKGTIGEAVAQGRMTKEQADEMLADRTDEEQSAYDEGYNKGKSEAIRQVQDIIQNSEITYFNNLDNITRKDFLKWLESVEKKIGELK